MYCGNPVTASRNIRPEPTKVETLASYDAELESRAPSEEERTAWQKNVGVRGAGTPATEPSAPRKSRQSRAAPSGATACISNIPSKPGKPAHQCRNRARAGSLHCGIHGRATAPVVDWDVAPKAIEDAPDALPWTD